MRYCLESRSDKTSERASYIGLRDSSPQFLLYLQFLL